MLARHTGRPDRPEECVISLELLKKERDELKKRLTAIEAEAKELDGKIRDVRQREIQTKREIEAISVLVDLQEAKTDTK
jgi:vacuolar-type H+-ATPase subunit D/Vma8